MISHNLRWKADAGSRATITSGLDSHGTSLSALSATRGRAERLCRRSFSAFCLRISAFPRCLSSNVDGTHSGGWPLSIVDLNFSDIFRSHFAEFARHEKRPPTFCSVATITGGLKADASSPEVSIRLRLIEAYLLQSD